MTLSVQKITVNAQQSVHWSRAHLALHKDLASAKTPQEQESTRSERQVQSTDRMIDRLVYELYGLTEEEIAIVES